MRWSRGIFVLVLCVPLASCVLFSKLDEVERDRRSVYKKSRSLPDLEIPPDLIAANASKSLEIPQAGDSKPAAASQATQAAAGRPETPAAPTEDATRPGPLSPTKRPATASADTGDYNEDASPSTVLAPERLPTDADDHTSVAALESSAGVTAPQLVPPDHSSALDEGKILEVGLDSNEEVWIILREFWRERGLSLELDDSQAGVQQTVWQEPETDEPTWKRYTILSEGSLAGKTELLVTAEQFTRAEDGWLPQESNAELSLQLAEELSNFFGKAQVKVEIREDTLAPVGADTPRISESGDQRILLIPGDMKYNWVAVGEALDKAGLEIEEKNPGAGVYKVVSAGQRYQVSLSDSAQGTEVIILNEVGVWKQNDESAGRILALLLENFGG